MAIQKVISRWKIRDSIVIFCLCTIYLDFRDILVKEGLEEFLQAIINDGLVAFRIGNLLDLTYYDVYF